MESDIAYKKIIEDILSKGVQVTTRNSDVLRLTNQMITFTTAPLVTVRKTAWKSALREWEWFMKGSSNIKDLHHSVHPWWLPWADAEGEINNNYSKQFRQFVGVDGSVDQISKLQEGIEYHPFSRRNVITTWNTADMIASSTPITNCHGSLIQLFVDPETNELSLTMYQRSCDVVLGMQHNWIQYWAFLMWLARCSKRKVGSFTWIGGDCHVYSEHFDIAKEIVDTDASALPPVDMIYDPSTLQFSAKDFALDAEYKPIITKRPEMIV